VFPVVAALPPLAAEPPVDAPPAALPFAPAVPRGVVEEPIVPLLLPVLLLEPPDAREGPAAFVPGLVTPAVPLLLVSLLTPLPKFDEGAVAFCADFLCFFFVAGAVPGVTVLDVPLLMVSPPDVLPAGC
jgi:hypothetical protein